MADYVNIPTVDLNFLRPKGVSFDTLGGQQEGPRNGLGHSIMMNVASGAHVVASYNGCMIHDPEEFEYFDMIGARGPARFMNWPIINTWTLPTRSVGGLPIRTYTPLFDEDGSFIDGATSIEPAVRAKATAPAALNAGTVSLRVSGGNRRLRHAAWFSFQHAVKGHRAYRVWNIDSAVADGNSVIYTFAITPALREAIVLDQEANFVSPRFVGRLAPGVGVPYMAEDRWIASHSIDVMEAF